MSTATGIPAREQVIELLKAAGFAEHAPKSRRKRDPDPADGFRVFTDHDGSVLVVWVPVGGGDHKEPGQLARSREMAGRYAEAARAAGWAAGIGGIIWHHARLARAGETPLEHLDETLVHDGAHWIAEGPRGALWVVRWFSAAGNVAAWKHPRGRTGFRAEAADLPAARREAARIAGLIADGKTRED